MYKSPIEIICGDIQKQIDNDIYRVTQKYDIKVDKNELIQALQYDRDQYEKGYDDGKRDAMDSIVRCKDCRKCSTWDDIITGVKQYRCRLWCGYRDVDADSFCDAGEREDNV